MRVRTSSLYFSGLNSSVGLDADFRERADLVGVHEVLHHQAAFGQRPDLHQVLLAAGGVARQRGLAAAPHRLRQQPVGAIGAFLRSEVVGLVEVDRIDLLAGNEFGDFDLL